VTAAVEARGLAFAYRPDVPVLSGVSFALHMGELTAILGPNGSGKTTLLRLLLGLLRPDSGEVWIAGRSLPGMNRLERARTLAYVPQVPATAFDFTAMEVALIGRYARLGWVGMPGRGDLEIAHLALEMTGAAELADRPFRALSGGEAQRVAIARALAQQPKILLLDEPTSHLDLRHQQAIGAMLRRVAHDWPMCVACVVHDPNLAARFADRAILLDRGRVAADGPPGAALDPDLLGRVYGVAIERLDDGRGGHWIVAREPPGRGTAGTAAAPGDGSA